ncbi:TIP41-like protein isoform X1 [Hydractinia symbiolongicarpus]|uniref:TIP41-like protein isoform X1 n=2 Tax=Hydractinia symbiolongicarpus TaxID=13093 RepID=UPI00254D161F|nr:TIP41-like protein isoform X1 [Hydractinia symbiolongicarpus]
MAVKISKDNFVFGPWEIIASKGPILKSSDVERIIRELNIPDIPEMVFGDTILEIKNECGFKVFFTAIDALRLVDNKRDLMKVGVADEWQKQRADCEYIQEVLKPYDWTYSTNYKGNVVSPTKVTTTDDRIDMEKLKRREKIHFYQDLLLFEDELADHGIAKLSVKMRVMPSSFFILLRFFLRVDGVLLRINDTRIYHEAGSNYILREYTSKEKKISQLQNPFADEAILAEQLDLVKEEVEKIVFEEESCNSNS